VQAVRQHPGHSDSREFHRDPEGPKPRICARWTSGRGARRFSPRCRSGRRHSEHRGPAIVVLEPPGEGAARRGLNPGLGKRSPNMATGAVAMEVPVPQALPVFSAVYGKRRGSVRRHFGDRPRTRPASIADGTRGGLPCGSPYRATICATLPRSGGAFSCGSLTWPFLP
jgi:hypothetical protein